MNITQKQEWDANRHFAALFPEKGQFDARIDDTNQGVNDGTQWVSLLWQSESYDSETVDQVKTEIRKHFGATEITPLFQSNLCFTFVAHLTALVEEPPEESEFTMESFFRNSTPEDDALRTRVEELLGPNPTINETLGFDQSGFDEITGPWSGVTSYLYQKGDTLYILGSNGIGFVLTSTTPSEEELYSTDDNLPFQEEDLRDLPTLEDSRTTEETASRDNLIWTGNKTLALVSLGIFGLWAFVSAFITILYRTGAW
jgi:hypothetical protein